MTLEPDEEAVGEKSEVAGDALGYECGGADTEATVVLKSTVCNWIRIH